MNANDYYARLVPQTDPKVKTTRRLVIDGVRFVRLDAKDVGWLGTWSGPLNPRLARKLKTLRIKGPHHGNLLFEVMTGAELAEEEERLNSSRRTIARARRVGRTREDEVTDAPVALRSDAPILDVPETEDDEPEDAPRIEAEAATKPVPTRNPRRKHK